MEGGTGVIVTGGAGTAAVGKFADGVGAVF
jgi:hypothetical protein